MIIFNEFTKERLRIKSKDSYQYKREAGWIVLNSEYAKTSSPRQDESKRLWVDRGQLERCKSNLVSCIRIAQKDRFNGAAATMNYALESVQRLIDFNKSQYDSISTRIPKEKVK